MLYTKMKKKRRSRRTRTKKTKQTTGQSWLWSNETQQWNRTWNEL